MELWIKSQDKRTLINTRRIDVDDNNIIVWDEGRYAEEIFLGTYKTKERALEVLDEIQNRIINIQIFNKDEKALKNNNPMYTYMKCVYEMPKE